MKNYLGIKDQDKLDSAERDITSYKEAILKDNPIKGKFDLKHLQDIHKHLFGDIYPFAGKLGTDIYRKVSKILLWATVLSHRLKNCLLN